MATQGKRRALGQHFLRDQKIADTIAETAVEMAKTHGCQALLEVGPGKGAITFPIMERLPQEIALILAERDRQFAEDWKTIAPEARHSIRVEEGDFVQLPESRWLTQTPLAVASNLPYSAGTAIVTRLAEHPHQIPVMVLMFQAEVARRLRAEVGTKEWGGLSVWIQNRWDVKKLLFVPPKAFVPPPMVDSEVVVLTPRKEQRIPFGEKDPQGQLWEKLIHVAFAHRRKMLRSGLPGTGPWRNALELSGVDGTKRSEALQWEEWESLYQALLKVHSS